MWRFCWSGIFLPPTPFSKKELRDGRLKEGKKKGASVAEGHVGRRGSALEGRAAAAFCVVSIFHIWCVFPITGAAYAWTRRARNHGRFSWPLCRASEMRLFASKLYFTGSCLSWCHHLNTRPCFMVCLFWGVHVQLRGAFYVRCSEWKHHFGFIFGLTQWTWTWCHILILSDIIISTCIKFKHLAHIDLT